jgi:hypothetical protein
VQPGDRIRARRPMSEDVNGEIGIVRTVMSLTGEPSEVVKVWEVAPQDGGPTLFIDPGDTDLVISIPCPEGNPTDDTLMAGSSRWPECIESGILFPSADGAGLFVNLEALNITEGCFRKDCSRSDHFACASPAACARVCSQVRACRWWTFQEQTPSTCWLRGDGVRTHEEAPGHSSGSVECLPPADEPDILPQREPTLFELIGGIPNADSGEIRLMGATTGGVSPSRLWSEPDLIGALQDFGHMTVKQLRRAAPPSERQRSALRVAALAASKCAEGWRGCS